MNNRQKFEVWLTLAMIIPVVITVFGIGYIPYELNWFVNNEASAPSWLSPLWWISSFVVLFVIYKSGTGSDNMIGTLLCMFFGPYTLIILAEIWAFKKLGWLKI